VPGLCRIALALLLAFAAGPAAALPLGPAGGFERAAPGFPKGAPRVLAGVITEPLALPGDDSITALDGPPLDNVPEPDTLAILGGAIAAFAVVALIRRNRRGK
jgi:hypothetical protein